MEQSAGNEAVETAELLMQLVRMVFVQKDDAAVRLPMGQLRVCGALQAGPRSMSSIGRELGVSLSAMTQIADRLERNGLVERVAGDDDRRIRRLRLTDVGECTMRRREETRIGRLAVAIERLSPSQRNAVLRAMQALYAACAAGSDDRTLRKLPVHRLGSTP